MFYNRSCKIGNTEYYGDLCISEFNKYIPSGYFTHEEIINQIVTCTDLLKNSQINVEEIQYISEAISYYGYVLSKMKGRYKVEIRIGPQST